MYSKIKDILKNINLLIVDNDDELLKTLKISVENYVNQIFICKNAKDAINCFKENKYKFNFI